MVNNATTSPGAVPSLPTDKSTGDTELVAVFDDPIHIGVVVSKQGLVDRVEFTVEELKQFNQSGFMKTANCS